VSHRVPTYALYGEHQQPLMPEALHVESIADRSRLYNWEISPHRHDLFAQLLCLRSGHGEVLFADARVPFEAPCVITVPPLEEHGFRFSRDMDGLVITVVAHRLQGLLQAAPELVERLSVPHCLRFSPGSAEFAEIDRACTLLAREMRGAAPWRMNLVEASLVTVAGAGRARRRGPGAHHAGPVAAQTCSMRSAFVRCWTSAFASSAASTTTPASWASRRRSSTASAARCWAPRRWGRCMRA